MTPEELTVVATRIERPLRASLARDVLQATEDPYERLQLIAGVTALVLAGLFQWLPPDSKASWMEHIVRAVLTKGATNGEAPKDPEAQTPQEQVRPRGRRRAPAGRSRGAARPSR